MNRKFDNSVFIKLMCLLAILNSSCNHRFVSSVSDSSIENVDTRKIPFKIVPELNCILCRESENCTCEMVVRDKVEEKYRWGTLVEKTPYIGKVNFDFKSEMLLGISRFFGSSGYYLQVLTIQEGENSITVNYENCNHGPNAAVIWCAAKCVVIGSSPKKVVFKRIGNRFTNKCTINKN